MNEIQNENTPRGWKIYSVHPGEPHLVNMQNRVSEVHVDPEHKVVHVQLFMISMHGSSAVLDKINEHLSAKYS